MTERIEIRWRWAVVRKADNVPGCETLVTANEGRFFFDSEAEGEHSLGLWRAAIASQPSDYQGLRLRKIPCWTNGDSIGTYFDEEAEEEEEES